MMKSTGFVGLMMLGMCGVMASTESQRCPVCRMTVQEDIFQSFKGNQAVYACYMPNHLGQLKTTPAAFLATPMKIDSIPSPYSDETDMECPVCGGKHLTYSVPWKSDSNQSLFACSEAHAKLLAAAPTMYFLNETKSELFCSGGAVMFNGFESSIGNTCVRMLFQEWDLTSALKYVCGLIGALVLSIGVEALGVVRGALHDRLLETFGYTTNNKVKALASSEPLVPMQAHEKAKARIRMPLYCRLLLAVAYMVHITAGYVIMLLVMSYDSGMFLVILAGLTIGYFIVNDVTGSLKYRNPDPCCCT